MIRKQTNREQRKNREVNYRQTENREKTEKSITETTLFPDGLLGTIIQIFKYTLVAVQYSIINVWQHYTV